MCLISRDREVCDRPLHIKQLDSVFGMTNPIMGRTDVIETALKQRVGSERSYLQVLLLHSQPVDARERKLVLGSRCCCIPCVSPKEPACPFSYRTTCIYVRRMFTP